MIFTPHLRQYVVAPTLSHLSMDSPAAQNLILGTIAQESAGGTYLQQLGGGPARGILQMEPATHALCWRWLDHPSRSSTRAAMRGLCLTMLPTPDEMRWNLRYAVGMARILYRSIPHILPQADDIQGLAAYWKRWYNTPKGKGTEREFILNYQRYVINVESGGIDE